MPRSTYLWLLKCLGLCLLGFIVLAFLGRSFTSLISWAIYRDNPTPRLRNAFAMRYYLPLCVAYGFLFGLIPVALGS
jgi:hypothetical protein